MLASMMGQSEPGAQSSCARWAWMSDETLYMVVEEGILQPAVTWRKSVIKVIEEIRCSMWRRRWSPSKSNSGGCHDRSKKRERRESGQEVWRLCTYVWNQGLSRGRSVFPRHGHERLARVSCLRTR